MKKILLIIICMFFVIPFVFGDVEIPEPSYIDLGAIPLTTFISYTPEQIRQGMSFTFIDESYNHDWINFEFSMYSIREFYTEEDELEIHAVQLTKYANLHVPLLIYCLENYQQSICIDALVMQEQPYTFVIEGENVTINPIIYQVNEMFEMEYETILQAQQDSIDYLDYQQNQNIIIQFLEALGL